MKNLFNTAMKLYSTGDLVHAEKVIEKMKERDPASELAHYALVIILTSNFSNISEMAQYSSNSILKKNTVGDHYSSDNIECIITELRRCRRRIALPDNIRRAIKNAEIFCSNEHYNAVKKYLSEIMDIQEEIIDETIDIYTSRYDVILEAESLVGNHYIQEHARKKKELETKKNIMIVLSIVMIVFGYVTFKHAFDVPEESTITEGFWIFSLFVTALSSILFIKILINVNE